MSEQRGEAKAKNKEYAQIQITAEQLIREAQDNKQISYKAPKITIHDEEELMSFRLSKRKEYEALVSSQRKNPRSWIKYASWEEDQGEYTRARSIYERALEQDYTKGELWSKYADFELRISQVNRARNVLERATYLLPMVYNLWYKYVKLEETVGNYGHCEEIFEKWMTFDPNEYAWMSYIKYLIRLKEVEKARKLFVRATEKCKTETIYVEWIQFEKRFGGDERTRGVFEEMGKHEELCENGFYEEFANFEVSVGELERAREILKYGIDHVGKLSAALLYEKYVDFEKANGEMEEVDFAVYAMKRFTYETEVQTSRENYNYWFDYIMMEMNEIKSEENTRELFERVISTVPQKCEKSAWTRYIEFWVLYARFEEKHNNIERAQHIFEIALKLIPHAQFTFKKVWVAFAEFCVRNHFISLARKAFGCAIGYTQKDDVFEKYIAFEKDNNEDDRVKRIEEKWDEVKKTREEELKKMEEENVNTKEEGEDVRDASEGNVQENLPQSEEFDEFYNNVDERE
ncbi:crooked neck protein, putative [Entamoeba invadens IP1]|uniref:Crooked neck protein, putative n=1 Tax=Entamoeba invadens IP1 TaxID=370355 RepID=A0A0A1UE30_ENTIV|nr:crooked neck protein, putative [Entamoeba invadens IP1]ELP91060.1 crooked neck protein, putative [Entamoeba invadens IP1]|eukprot:XP_004257831.1 crooked neck protein, putative [Entamoeba invadens IP1]